MRVYANIGVVFPWTLNELKEMTLEELEEWQGIAAEYVKKGVKI